MLTVYAKSDDGVNVMPIRTYKYGQTSGIKKKSYRCMRDSCMDHDTGSFTSNGVNEFERWKNQTLRKDRRDTIPGPSGEGWCKGLSRWRVDGANSDRRRVGTDPLAASLRESRVTGEGGDEAEDCSIGSSGVCMRNVARPSTDARLKSGGGPSSPGTSGELCTRRRSEPFFHHCVIPAGGGI